VKIGVGVNEEVGRTGTGVTNGSGLEEDADPTPGTFVEDADSFPGSFVDIEVATGKNVGYSKA